MVSGDYKNCPSCKSNGGKPNSLDNPNILSAEVTNLISKISFACPNICGVRNIEFLDLHHHLIFDCVVGASNSKQEVMGRMYVLRLLLETQKKEHRMRIEKLKEQMTKKIQKVKD